MHIQLLTIFFCAHFLVACQQMEGQALTFEAGGADSSLTYTEGEFINVTQPIGNRLLKSTDGGQSWEDAGAGLPGDVEINCFLPHNGEAILGAGDGLYRKSTASTASIWQKDYSLNGQITGIYPTHKGLYVCTSKEGLVQQISGDIWASVFKNFEDQRFRTVFEAADQSLFYCCDNGIFKSTDQGKTYRHVYTNGWVIEMAESNGVLICTNEQGILRSTDGGEHWEVVISEGGVGINVEVIQGGFAAISYNTTSKTRRVRISEDGGKTWQAIDAGLPPSANIASIKQVGEYFFCGHPDGIFRSADRGKTWQRVHPPIKDKVFHLSVSGKVIYAVPQNQGC